MRQHKTRETREIREGRPAAAGSRGERALSMVHVRSVGNPANCTWATALITGNDSLVAAHTDEVSSGATGKPVLWCTYLRSKSRFC